MQTRYAIIGSGIAGLSAAYYLLKNKDNIVDIYEKEPHIGGLATFFKIESRELEKFYHHIFTTDKYIISLIDELGLSNNLHWYKDNTSIFYDDNLHPFMGAIDLIRFSPLGIIDRFRMGFIAFLLTTYFTKNERWKSLEKYTAEEWMIKYAGKNAFDILWKPLLIGKFGNPMYKTITMSWLWARLATRSNSNGKLGYMDGSFSSLFKTLEKTILKNKGHILTNANIESIEKVDKNFLIKYFHNNENYNKEYDKVIVTTPAGIYSKFIKGLSENYIKKVLSINYLSAQTIILTIKKQLSKYYWISVNDISSPALAIIEQTNLEDKSSFNDKHVIYIGNYLPNDSKVLRMEKEELKKLYIPFLKKINKNFDESWILNMEVFRAPFAQPIVDKEYKNHIPDVNSPIKGLYICNMSQVYPQDRGMNFSIKIVIDLIKNINE